MAMNRKPNVAVGMAASFTVLTSVVMVLLITKTVSFQLGLLALVALVGLHLGFGILIAVHRLMDRLK
jgi:hypothetical protein